ncbi:MAG: DUF4197 domain-containing protein [Gammaproteobacteria bacterium]|nr:DUF4197 domain-containing protein [Gammaproteobacteria bacterium]
MFSVSAGHTLAAERWWERATSILSGSDESQGSGQLDSSEIGDAFKQALSIGSEEVVRRLGGVDGFNADPAIHIPLPGELNRVKSMLATVGMSGVVDDLELKLNRAAEEATPIARDLFLQAIAEMSFEDVMRIYQGPNDSATTYFQEKMSSSLSNQMNPIVAESLSQVGAIQVLDQIMGRYQSIPFASEVEFDMAEYVVQKGMDGIFFYLAQEEASIRENPVKQTTDLLKKVFGSSLGL